MQNDKQIRCGESNIQMFFESKKELDVVFLSWLSTFFTNFQTYCFEELTEEQRQIFLQTKFTLKSSNSFTPSTVSNFNKKKHEIFLNRGMFKFLIVINSVFHSVLDPISAKEIKNQDEFKSQASNLLSSFCLLFDKYDEYPFLNINVEHSKDGIWSQFLTNDNPLDDMIKEFCNHQLEFILLHEIAHVLFPDYGEKQCDKFAIVCSRKIWDSGKVHHTYWCEYSQLVLFLIFELYEIHFQAHEFWVELLNKKQQHTNRIKYYKYLHPNSFERFENIIKEVKSISNFTKIQINILTSFFNYYYKILLTNELSYVTFLNICSIDRQNRDKTFLTNFTTVNDYPKYKVKEFEAYKINPVDENFIEYERLGKLIPPFIRFFNEKLKIESHKIVTYFNKFDNLLNDIHGEFSKDEFKKEMQNNLVMVRNMNWKDNCFNE